ncbi:MAG: response regulator [Acidobacteria bacterium]|nr:response regulator [Acidobacteriota bacterium]
MARILLVEDHQALAALRCTILNRSGYDVVCTGDGEEACRLLNREVFDLVVTDAMLPKGSGVEVASAAQKHHLPVIFSSGWPSEKARQVADWVIPKPCSLSEFLRLVDSALQKAY